MKPWLACVRYNERQNDSVFAVCLDPLEGSGGEREISGAMAGQFYMLGFPGRMDPLLRRPFSHFHTIRHEGLVCLEIVYEVRGRGTRLLSSLGRGDTVSVMGPLGRSFSIPTDRDGLVMVAGGLGFIPVFSLLNSMKVPGVGKSIDFIWGVKTRRKFFRMDDLKGLYRSLGAGMNVHLATEDGSYDHKGTATELLEEVVGGLGGKKVEVFACGPPGMLKAVAALALERGISCQVSMEEKMGCGFGACLGCAVPARAGGYLHVCRDGPVIQAGMIDWDSI